MFEGVLVRNCLSIWGVMLFLRISWVVAEAGICKHPQLISGGVSSENHASSSILGQMFIIVSLSTFITMVTALSMSALSTNGDIGGGKSRDCCKHQSKYLKENLALILQEERITSWPGFWARNRQRHQLLTERGRFRPDHPANHASLLRLQV